MTVVASSTDIDNSTESIDILSDTETKAVQTLENLLYMVKLLCASLIEVPPTITVILTLQIKHLFRQ